MIKSLVLKFKPDYLKLLFYFFIINAILFFIFRLLLVFSYSPDIGGIESNVIYTVGKMLKGLPLYGNPEDFNFDITQYSPLFYDLQVGICHILSLDPINDLHAIYITGRSLSLLFNVAGMGMVYLTLSRLLKINKKISFITAVIQFFYLSKVHFAARPDGLFSFCYLVFLFLMIAYFMHENGNKRNNFLYLAGIMAVLSIFIKQNGIQLPLLLAGYFLIFGSMRDFLKISCLMLVIFSLGMLAFFEIYGTLFFKNVFGGLDNGISILRMYDVFSNFHLHSMLILALGIFLARLLFLSNRKPIEKFLSMQVIGLFLFALVTSLKDGSWINYYNEFVIVTLIFTIYFFQSLFVSKTFYSQENSILNVFYIYILMLIPSILLYNIYHVHLPDLKKNASSYEEKKGIARDLQQLCQKNAGTYFISFETELNAMLPVQAILPNKEIVVGCSKFNYKNYLAYIKSGRIRYMVTASDENIHSFLNADLTAFHPIRKYHNWVLWENQIISTVQYK